MKHLVKELSSTPFELYKPIQRGVASLKDLSITLRLLLGWALWASPATLLVLSGVYS
jgi:hypothetical protein